MKINLFFLIISLISLIGCIHAQDNCAPIGWATENGGTTGGGSNQTAGNTSTVNTYNDLKAALTSSSIKFVYVTGIISCPTNGRILISGINGKTITGLPSSKIISVDLTKDGSGILYIENCTNFILRNLIFEGPGAYDMDGYDNLCIDNCQNFWIDHCEFHDGMDGNFDIKNMSDFISITWCTFSYEKPPIAGGTGGSDDHRYSNLIGSSDNATGDAGKLNITFQYCWWGEGCRERMPRMRFGKLHMANNLFTSSVSNHCIRAGYKADVLAEGNYFDNQKLPIDLYNNDFTAVKGINNFGASNVNQGIVFIPPYVILVDAPTNIVTPIKTCAGAKLTGSTFSSPCCNQTSIEVPSVVGTDRILVNPNPFVNTATIFYTLDQAAEIRTQIINIYDQVIYERNLGNQLKGDHQIVWDGKSNSSANIPDGIYSLTIQSDQGIYKHTQLIKCK